MKIRILANIKSVLISIILICFSVFTASSNNRILQFNHITVDEGLSNSTVTCITQDYLGFMWIGTYEGLNRYCGTEIKHYRNTPNDSASIISNLIWTFFEDSDNDFYIGTNAGISRYSRDMDNFEYLFSGMDFFNVSNIITRNIQEDNENNLWLATSIGIIKYNKTSKKPELFNINTEDKKNIISNDLEYILVDKINKNILWCSTRSGLYRIDLIKKKIKNIVKNSLNLNISHTFFNNIAQDKNNDIWISSHEGLCKVFQDEYLDSIIIYKNTMDANKHSYINRMNTLLPDEDVVWIGTENGGLSLFDKKNLTFSNYKNDEYDPYSLNNESLITIFKDQTSNIWIGTFTGGINKLKYYSESIVHYKKIPGLKEGLRNNVITCFVEDDNGIIWVGTDGGGLHSFDHGGKKFRQFSTENSAISSNAVISLLFDSKKRLWVGTYAGGLDLFDPATQKFKNYSVENNSLPENNIFAIAEDVDDILWLGTLHNGLVKFNLQQRKYQIFSPSNSSISNPVVTKIVKTGNNKLLIGTSYLLNTVDLETETITPFSFIGNIGKENVFETIFDIFIENDTSAWICTQNGLYQLNPQTMAFSRYGEQQGLPEVIVKSIWKIKDTLWLGTEKGLNIYNLKKRDTKTLTQFDGLQRNEFKYKSILYTSYRCVLVGGNKGFNEIYPDKLKNNTKEPRVLLTGLLLFNTPVKSGKHDSPLKKDISVSDNLVLSHDQNVITIKYAANDYTIPEKNEYMYMLENFDPEGKWNYVGKKTEVTYTNLHPGKYVFKVKACNNDKVWGTIPTELNIVVLPAWYQTILFRISVILIVLAIGLVLYFVRINALKSQKVRLELLVKERTKEIEEKNTELVHQSDLVNETNTILEERQQYIEEQSEELAAQKEDLISANDYLNETNTLLEERQQYIQEQSELLKAQADELRNKNEELNILNATKDKFFSIIAHDLRNPFASVLGFLELIFSRYETMDGEKRKNLIKIALDSSQRIYKLLENLLQWSRSQTGAIKFTPENFLFREIVNNNFGLISDLANKKNLNLEKSVEENLEIFGDKNMINTVIRNLLTNSIKFTENGTISISAKSTDKNIKITIKDTGIGISHNKIENLFDVEKNKSTKGTNGETGSGLGLIICKDFIDKHNGSISVTSEKGKGSTFTIELPHKDLNNVDKAD